MKNRYHKSCSNSYSGFTMIELIIVVVIIAVLASVLTPMLASVADRSKALAYKKEMRLAAAEQESGEDRMSNVVRPVFEKLDLSMKLAADYQRVGLEVYNRYRLDCEGDLEIRPPTSSSSRVSLLLPFPAGTVEAWNVQLAFLRGDGNEAVEPDGVEYRKEGIYWSGTLPSEESTRALLRYSVLGAERLEFELPPAKKLNQVNLDLDLSDTPAKSVSDYSLTPSSVDGDVVKWGFDNLVTSRSIVVHTPGTESPAGRLILLLRFMALAVLLFGGGFLYMSERHLPGTLDQFRLGHFALLATTYSVFFIVFAVLIYRVNWTLIPSLVAAAVASVPLVVVHAKKITNARFAICHILPLTVTTLGIVVNGVYGGPVRDIIFLIAFIGSVTYLTLAYHPKPSPGRPSNLNG